MALLVSLLAGTGALTACSSSGSSSEDSFDPELTDKELLGVYLENALYYYELGEYDRCEDQARRALEIDPKNEHFLLIYGRCRVRRGTAADIQAAIDIFEQHPNPDDFRVQESWGTAVERKGKFYEEASIGVRDGSRPTDAPDRGARADELLEEAHGFWRDAEAHYSRALVLRSGSPEALGGLVRTSALLGEFEQSIEHARDLIDSIKSSQRLVANQLEDDEISADRESSLFKDKRENRRFEIKARLHIATLLRQLGRLNEAVDEFDEIIYLEPEFAEAYSLKSQLLFDLGEYMKARTAITKFIEL
ncbi:MAG: tetratricopeptide repeat protein, partial [Planctomycetota bacterium]